MTPRLSILTPSVPSRSSYLAELMREVDKQIGELPVEHVVLIDNKRRSIGAKRQACLDIAIGDYIAFVDDDDKIRPDYVSSILSSLDSHPDVVTFEQHAYFDGAKFHIRFGLGRPNDELVDTAINQRGAWHVCVWRAGIARLSQFPKLGDKKDYGEDWKWAEPLNELPIREIHIDKVLHEYHYRSEVTEAQK